MNLSLGSLNKKTVIQIVVLLLVVVVGAGVYVRMQDGGLPFLDGLLGKEAPKAPPPPPPKPAAPTPPPKPPEPEYPAHAPKGQALGKAFAADSAVFEEGALVLRQGGDAELRIYLPGNRWETPAGKKFVYENAAGADLARVHLRLKQEGQEAPAAHEFAEKYSLKLEFGAEQNRKLPGKLKLTLPDEGKSVIAGTFEADIRGFRIVNGKPELGADSVDTLEYLALHEVLKDDPDKAVKDVDLRDGYYLIPGDAAKPKTGYLEAAYQVGEGAPVVQRFQFVKDKDEWRVLRVLAANQIVEAHPYEAPTAESPAEKQLIYQAAARLEKDVAKRHPKKGIYGAAFEARTNDKNRLGVCEASYRLAPGEEPVKSAYLFRQKKGVWTLERALAKTETVNLEKGIIQKKPTAAKPKAKAKAKPKTQTKR